MKKRYISLLLVAVCLVSVYVFRFCQIPKKTVRCSSTIKKEVMLMAEFGMIKEGAKEQSIGVISFKAGDILYGIGHTSKLNTKKDYSVQKIAPVFAKRSGKYLGGVLEYAYGINDFMLGKVKSDNEDGLIVECSKFNEDKYINIEIADEVISGDAELLMRDKSGKLQSYVVSIEIILERGEERLDIYIKDNNLKDLTGGIIPGMSGSPIVQNGKLIGVLSETYLSDCCKGKGKIIWNIDCLREHIY